MSIELHLPRIRQWARRVRATHPHAEFDDLVQDGVLGLMEAQARFRETRGASFETFSARRIHGAMVDGIRARLTWPRPMRAQRRRLRAMPLGTPLADQARICGVQAAHLAGVIAHIHAVETTSGVFAVEPMPDARCVRVEQRRRLRAALGALPMRHRTVLRRYYQDERTLRAIGAEFGVTEGRVSQLKQRALQKLRQVLVAA